MKTSGRHPHMRASRQSRRGGFTLMEVILSVVIVSIILGALVSTLMITQRGLAGSTNVARDASRGRDATDVILLDLSLAMSFSERTATAVTFLVPDRDGDGQPETIRYAWSGVVGDPLTRQVNGGTVAVLVDDVDDFSLDYLLRQFSRADVPAAESGETYAAARMTPAGGIA